MTHLAELSRVGYGEVAVVVLLAVSAGYLMTRRPTWQ